METGGLIAKYPLSAYSLDFHIDTGIDHLSGAPEGVKQSLLAEIWAEAVWLAAMTIGFLVWAFNLDLLNGPAGALQPVADAGRLLYTNLIGPGLMILGFAIGGVWAAWQAMHRRSEKMAAGLGMSMVCSVVGLIVVFAGASLLGWASQVTNTIKLGAMSAMVRGSLDDPAQVRRQVANYLFEHSVARPWVIANFGGEKVCVDLARRDADGFPRPVGQHDPTHDFCRSVTQAGADGHGGYAERFLAQPAGSDARTLEYEALKDGQVPTCAAGNPANQPAPATSGPGGGPGGNPRIPPSNVTPPVVTLACDAKQFAGYQVDKADAGAVDIQQEAMTNWRFALVCLFAFGIVRMAMLIGALAVGVLLAGVGSLLLLAFAPVALFLGTIPAGRTQAAFVGWGTWLIGLLFVGPVFAVILTVVFVTNAALTDAADTMGALWSFGLQTMFYWIVFRQRHAISNMVLKRVEPHVKGSMRRYVHAVRHPVSSATMGVVHPRYSRRQVPIPDVGGWVTRRNRDMREVYHEERRPEEGNPTRIPATDLRGDNRARIPVTDPRGGSPPVEPPPVQLPPPPPVPVSPGR